ncbi:hypothetical protein T03_5488, partial [Trichinella britovi]
LHKQHFVTCSSCSKGTSCGIILIFSSVFMLCFAFDLKSEVKFILLSSFRVAYRVEK